MVTNFHRYFCRFCSIHLIMVQYSRLNKFVIRMLIVIISQTTKPAPITDENAPKHSS